MRRAKGAHTQGAPGGDLGASESGVRERREVTAGTSGLCAGSGTGSGFSQAVAPVGAAPRPLAGVEAPRHAVHPSGPPASLSDPARTGRENAPPVPGAPGDAYPPADLVRESDKLGSPAWEAWWLVCQGGTGQ